MIGARGTLDISLVISCTTIPLRRSFSTDRIDRSSYALEVMDLTTVLSRPRTLSNSL